MVIIISHRCVLFVSPANVYPVDEQGEPTIRIRENVSVPGLTICGSLSMHGYEPLFIDMAADGFENRRYINSHLLRVGLENESVIEEIARAHPDALLLTSMFTTEQPHVIDPLVREVKEAFPDLPIVVGGQHATLQPDWLLESSSIDYVVLGEGEDTIIALLDSIFQSRSVEQVAGIAYRKGDMIRSTGRSPRLQNIDLPWAFNKVLYRGGRLRYNDEQSIRHALYGSLLPMGVDGDSVLYYSRGCPMACAYCAAAQTDGRTIRHAGHKRMIDDVRRLYQEDNISVFYNQTDTFGMHREDRLFLQDLRLYRKDHPEIIVNNPNASFARLFFDSAGRVDEELVNLYADAGFNVITLAIESFNPKYNHKINLRKISPSAINDLFQVIKQKGMGTEMYMMYGFPGQSLEELRSDERAASSIHNADVTSWFECSLFPGTAYYDSLIRNDNSKEERYKILLHEEGMFMTHVPKELNFSRISQHDMDSFRRQYPYPR